MMSSPPTRPLPARAAPLPGESLISLVRRTAQAMVDLQQLARSFAGRGVGKQGLTSIFQVERRNCSAITFRLVSEVLLFSRAALLCL